MTNASRENWLRRNKWFLFAAAFLMFAIVAALWWFKRSTTEIEQLFGGVTNVNIVSHPTSVEAFRIGPLPGSVSSNPTISDYPVLAGPVELPPDIVANVTETLLSSSTYGWEYSKSCMPNPGVRLSFIQGSRRVDVLLCFECDILLIARDGMMIDGEDFDHGRPELVRAAKVAFPDDAVIQGLKEKE